MKGFLRSAGRRLGRALGDTLARRIFLLLWVTLVAAQALAIGIVTWVRGDFMVYRVPAAPSLPPIPGLMRGPRPDLPPRSPSDAPGDDRAGPDFNRPHARFGHEFRDAPLPGDMVGEPGPDFRPMPQARLPGFRGITTKELMLDYGIRLLVTGLAAWLASRWLARPMRDLVRASQALGQSLHQQEKLPLLDEQRGTLEVRESAQVFNAMARQLRRQFNERGLMVAAISHDLRTPLTRLRMRLETLDIEEIQRQRSVEDIHEMNALVDAVMELFRGDGPASAEPLQDLDLHALAQAITDDLLEQHRPVSLAGGHEPVLAKGQPMALRRIVDNLVGNALRYGGRADISVGRDAQGAWLRVADTGPGIPEAQLEAVFQPFFRLDESRNRHTGGAGLGLYIARELALRQKGSLVLSNRPEGGLVAELRLG
ncbi:hypothetical protein CDN99_00365 [Roseateles aquatilis]|uniref:histidine kinase n=1 Tax=Roseateles aquatilis TaxID=431061 RepID=A0A246JKE4_9BURK|nr:ATP-binding protein [Roseateles aquatilis]OWQ93000.1 hypothetical protein CDN99_00365 [Roseateles aquatilis]